MTQLFANGAFSTLASPINNVTSQINIATGEGARFPGVGGNNDFFVAVITQAGATETSYELVRVYNRATDTFWVQRGWGGTTPQAWPAGSKIEIRQTAENINMLNVLLPISYEQDSLFTSDFYIPGKNVGDNFEYVIESGEKWEHGFGTVTEKIFNTPLNNPTGSAYGDNWSSQWSLAVNSAYIFKFSGAWLVRHSRATGEYIDTIQNTLAGGGIAFGAASESLLIECQGYGAVQYYTSTNNGTSWTARSFPTWYAGWNYIEYANNTFYFVSQNDNFLYWSTDGIAWSRNASDQFVSHVRPVYFQGYWYAIDYSTGYVKRSTTLANGFVNVWTDTYYGNGDYHFSVVKDNTRLLLVNSGGTSWYSDDGTTKTEVPASLGTLYNTMNFMVNPDGKYALVQAFTGTSTQMLFLITNNGINWTSMGPGLDIGIDGNVKTFAYLTNPDTLFLGETYSGTPYSVLFWDVNNYMSGLVRRSPTEGSETLPVSFSGPTRVRARCCDSSGTVIQSKRAESSGTIQFTTLIPVDNTKPQITEGTLVLTNNFKPKRATSKLVVEADVFCAAATAGTAIIAALFTTGNNDALAVAYQAAPAAHYGVCLKIRFELLAGNTNSRAFHVRLGTGSGSVTFNGSNNTPYYGGSLISHLTVTEIGG